MKLATLQAGQFVETGGYYTKGDAGQARYLIVAAQAADGYGDHTLANGTVAVLQVGDEVHITKFGVIADGVLSDGTKNPTPTDNKLAIQAACNVLIKSTYPQYQGGVLIFPSGVNVCVATSGYINLPEAQIKGNGCKIRPIGNPDSVFILDLIHTTNTRRFTKNWLFERFTMYTDRGFGVDTQATDCGHLLTIRGGWMIRSTMQYIDVDPGFACRSLIDWDLTHPDIGNVTEIGVPDGNEFKNISAQYAENTSFALSFSGDLLGTGSRASSTVFRNIYNSISYPHGFITRSEVFSDFGVIRIDNVRMGGCRVSEVFGVNPIRMFNSSEIGSSELNRVYVEFNSPRCSDFESIFRGGVYSNCTFTDTFMYTQNVALQASPRFFFATFTNCTFVRLSAFVQSQLTNPPDANFMNLGVASSGCRIINKPDISNQPENPGMAWILTKISAPADTVFEFLTPKLLTQTVRQVISANGTYLLGSIPNDITEITAWLKTSLKILKINTTSVDIGLVFGGTGTSGVGISKPITLVSSDYDDGFIEGEFIGRSDTKPTPSATEFSTNAVYSFESTNSAGETIYNGDDDFSIQYNSGGYDVSLVVTNLVGTITLGNFMLEYGHSSEYVNVI